MILDPQYGHYGKACGSFCHRWISIYLMINESGVCVHMVSIKTEKREMDHIRLPLRLFARCGVRQLTGHSLLVKGIAFRQRVIRVSPVQTHEIQ
jgi:hypothetical protein